MPRQISKQSAQCTAGVDITLNLTFGNSAREKHLQTLLLHDFCRFAVKNSTPPQNSLNPNFHHSEILFIFFLPPMANSAEYPPLVQSCSTQGATATSFQIILFYSQHSSHYYRHAPPPAPGTSTRCYVCQVSTGTTNELKTLNIGNIFTSPPSFVQSCMHQHQQERGSPIRTSM